MGNDLISREALLGHIKDGLNAFPPFVDDTDKEAWIIRWIENAETVFNVDKIVGQLEGEYLACRCKNNESCSYPETIRCCYDRAIDKAIGIIKAGVKGNSERSE